MKSIEEIYELLKSEFGASILEHDETSIIVDTLSMDKIAEYLKNSRELSFDSLMCLSGVEEPKDKKSEDEDKLSVYYHLHSLSLKHKLTIKVATPKRNPEVESVEKVWACAGWHEREAYDLLGIKFIHNSDLRRILLPDDWEGHPLRKDYVTPEMYNGMQVTDTK